MSRADAPQARAKKSYGQHFLHNAATLDRIAALALAELPSGEAPGLLFEIGPGTGNLTAALLDHPRARPVVAIEADRELLPGLEARFEGRALQLIHGRAERLSLAALTSSPTDRHPPWVVVGNLPYYVAAPIYFRLLAQTAHVRRAVLMFQAEVADRIAADEGSRAYGVPSVITALWGRARVALRVPPGAFSPPPKVDSAVVVVDLCPEPRLDTGGDPAGFTAFVRATFAARRKTLPNAMAGAGIDKLAATHALEGLGLDPRSRAEALSPPQLAALYRAVRTRPGGPSVAQGDAR